MQDTIKKIIELAGGLGNIGELDNCLTRVRIIVKDEGRISKAAAKDLEKSNNTPVIHGKNVHVIIGTKAGEYRKAIGEALKSPNSPLALDILNLAGGLGNISELDNCLTRVRIIVKDAQLINSKAAALLEKQGFASVIHGKNIHVIMGKIADECTKEIKKSLS